MIFRGGQANLFLNSANRKFLGSFRYLKSANFLGLQVNKSAKFYIILQISFSKQSWKSSFDTVFPHVQIWITAFYAIFIRRKNMYLRTWGRSFNSANHKNKTGHANRKSAKCHICGRSANLIHYLSPLINGFAEFICGPPTSADFIKAEHVVLYLNYTACSLNFINQFLKIINYNLLIAPLRFALIYFPYMYY